MSFVIFSRKLAFRNKRLSYDADMLKLINKSIAVQLNLTDYRIRRISRLLLIK